MRGSGGPQPCEQVYRSSCCGSAEMSSGLVSMRMLVRSLALLSGSGIWHCCELWCKWQTWFGFCVAVAVAVAGRCSTDSTPSLGISICCRCASKRKKEKKKKKKKRTLCHQDQCCLDVEAGANFLEPMKGFVSWALL